MNLLWTRKARSDLLAHLQYIAQDDMAAAARLNELFHAKAAALERFPQLGRPGRVAGTRELLLASHYILVYTVTEDTVFVVSLLHAAQLYPPESGA